MQVLVMGIFFVAIVSGVALPFAGVAYAGAFLPLALLHRRAL